MFIKPLKKKKINIYKNRIYFSCDFETIAISNIHYVYIAGLMYLDNNKNIYKTFHIDSNTTTSNIELNSLHVIKELITFLLYKFKEKDKKIIYMHNLRSFDGFFIIECINKFFKDNKEETVIRNNLIYKISFKNIIFLDTLNICNNSLDRLSTSFLKKKKIKFNVQKIKSISDIKKYYKKITNYLYTDVYLLFQIVEKLLNIFYKEFNIDIVKYYTISSISMFIYRTYYLKEDIEITKEHKYKYIKYSYYGGLCNLHYTTSKNGYYYDINSLYPYVMSSKEMPLGVGTFITKIETTDLTNYFGFISCDIFVPNFLDIPPLPMKNKNNINVYAHGYLKGIWFSEELKNAIKLGCKIIKIYKILHYKKKKNIFKEFVEFFNLKKETANDIVSRTLNKNIMNSLYGRFGLSLDKDYIFWNNLKEDEKIILEHFTKSSNIMNNSISLYSVNKKLYNYLISNPDFEKKKYEIKKLYRKLDSTNAFSISSLQISSAISSYARIKMINEIYDHKKKNNATIFYYDTDSIFTNKPLPKSKVDFKKIGLFKLEKAYKKAIFIAPKVYCFKDLSNKTTLKFTGINKKYILNDYNYIKQFLKKNSVLKISNVHIPIKKSVSNLKIYSNYYNYNFDFYTDKYTKKYINNYFYKTIPIYIDEEYWSKKIN